MPQISYSVTATLPDRHAADRYLRWLTEGHVQEVLKGGAHDARVVELESDHAVQVETTYLFPDRSTYETYVREHAPRLRADGLRRFGEQPGVSFTRRQGSVIFQHQAGVRPS